MIIYKVYHVTIPHTLIMCITHILCLLSSALKLISALLWLGCSEHCIGTLPIRTQLPSSPSNSASHDTLCAQPLVYELYMSDSPAPFVTSFKLRQLSARSVHQSTLKFIIQVFKVGLGCIFYSQNQTADQMENDYPTRWLSYIHV